MKEYEYIVEALEGYLCDQLAGVICSENYTDRSYNYGYLNIFKEYCGLHQRFCDNQEKYVDPVHGQKVREELQHEYMQRRQDIRNRFMKDVQDCVDIKIDSYEDDYLKKLDEEEIKTVAKRICLYPYLVSVMRENRKGEDYHGKKV